MDDERPNVVFIYADDLGRGMLSCYGQKRFKTPNIDSLAAAGVRFTRSYGCVFCAPARASLLLGRHDCHAGDWTFTAAGIYEMISAGRMTYADIRELINNTGIQAGPDDVFLPQLFKRAGYVTGQVGKLEWGFATSPERIARHGWDYHYGYYDHVRCHGFYPPFLFENGEKIDIPGNTLTNCGKHPETDDAEGARARHDRTGKAVYSQDLFDRKVLEFLRAHHRERFFLYHPSQLPHGPISIPEIHPDVAEGPELTEFEKEYASMVLRLDRTVGLILEELERLGVADRTLVVFSSDNGHEHYCRSPGRSGSRDRTADGAPLDNITSKFYSDLCNDVFDGNDGMAGLKTTNWEGGARIPYLVKWPGNTAPGSSSDHMLAGYDLFATFAELVGQDMPGGKDGISFLPAVLGRIDRQERHDYVVYASFFWGPSLVSEDGWKLRRINKTDTFQLYYLPDDYREERDLASQRPDKVAELAAKMLEACDGDYAHGHIRSHLQDYEDERVKAYLSRPARRVTGKRNSATLGSRQKGWPEP